MQEIELKLQIPPAARAAVDKALRGRGSPPQTLRLVAAYFDTPDRRLARAGMALRVRREGRQWVQTLKAGGPNALQRLEHNVPRRPPAGGVLAPDLSLHDGTPAAALLHAALAPVDGQPAAPLVELYRTDIRRTSRSRRTPLGTVELAWDVGHIAAGGRRLAVSELEIELLRGDPRAVIEEARRWVQGHGLWLDTQTKAHRGDHLARGAQPQPRVVAWPVLAVDGQGPTVGQAWERIHAVLLTGLLDNASAIAAGQGQPEHLRRLRVGLRRLRSAWRLFDGWGPAAADDVKRAAVALYRHLGQARDSDVLAALVPALEQAGAPRQALHAPVQPAVAEAGQQKPPHPTDALTAELRSPAVNQLWLELLALGLPPAATPAGNASGRSGAAAPSSGPTALRPASPTARADAPGGSGSRAAGADVIAADDAAERTATLARPLRPLALRRLKRWHHRAAEQAVRYAELSDTERHELRKQLKRLRDGLDATAALLPPRRLRKQLAALKAAQDALGQLNDEVVAAQLARQQADAGHGPAWFIVGWLAARRDATVQAAGQALHDWRDAPAFWK